ncbi:carboxynorspermidine decarboxylase [Luteolibacter ambystomatis]|uniref:Carboxynorspermidine/carboxyspermidine decarboxylase n=1 Tax=Luteolibacter ambystomatis TaxID=2824561 RepID=A0A975J1C8_9BACT|nr:carboxynorspermidine decarboxylase [Luteolibacter ambystomatis]QUE52199.1 carboxynorspermidine decarboxylase [Luteolibacter ambystomatis]
MSAAYVISLPALERNARILRETADAAGCKLVLALKGFSCWKAFDAIRPYLDGCCASGLWEGLLARDYFGKHVVTYSPGYTEDDIRELCEFTDHLDFNSLSQWFRFREIVMAHPRFKSGDLLCGLRVNPQCSTGSTPLYDPCVAGSRLGITADQLEGVDLTGLSGLHFHTLCEQNSDDLEKTLVAVEEKFGHLLRSKQFTYLNMGGGHWITKPFYDRALLVRLVQETKARYGVEVWLEPGEAAAIHTGVLRSTVLDVFESAGHKLAILDISATAHMPDVLEMPYRPDVYLVDRHEPPVEVESQPAVTFEGEFYHPADEPSADPGVRDPQAAFVYRIGGPTCLAGDVTGDFAFHRPLAIGDVIVFDDMAHYTMVKTTTFNGVKHPAIVLQKADGTLETIREFGYADFRDRLA